MDNTTNIIRINEPYVSYSKVVNLTTEMHVFRVSIVNLFDNNIEPSVDSVLKPFFILLNPTTNNQIIVSLFESNSNTRIYTNYFKGQEINSSLCVQLIVS